jgi:hypothetical protein
VLPHTEIAKLSSEGAEAANRKRRRARAWMVIIKRSQFQA